MDDENLMDIETATPCEVCGAKESKYTCPKCEVRTCCLKCVRIHKKELECDGIRDKTKFVKMNSFTNLDLLSDYRLLEECSRSVERCKKDYLRQIRRPKSDDLPLHLYRLRAASTRREMILKFLPQAFTRRKENTTNLDWKNQTIYWKVDWVFPSADNIKLTDENCVENEKLGILLTKYFEPENLEKIVAEKLQYYHAAGMNGIELLLKAEEKRGKKFYRLDLSKTMKESLKWKIVIENPTVFVVLKNDVEAYDVVDSEDEREVAVKEEEEDKQNIMQRLTSVRVERQKRKNKKNLLITTGYSDEESINGSSSEEDSSASDIKIPKRMFI